MITVVLAFDAGSAAGMGHLRRMEALGASLVDLGATVDLVPAESPVVGCDVVVVDSYHFRADDRSHFRAPLLIALDDLRRNLAVDVVVDPSPGSTAEPHRAAGCVLAGPSFALLDPTLAHLPVRPVGGAVEVVLVATGAADRAGVGSRIAATLVRLLPESQIRLAVGPWSEGVLPDDVLAVRTDSGLGPTLAEADLVITAAGVTLLEALALGRPTVAVVLAENQRQAAQGAIHAGAIEAADETDAANIAAALAGDMVRRGSLSACALRLVDGRGAHRVASAVLARSS